MFNMSIWHSLSDFLGEKLVNCKRKLIVKEIGYDFIVMFADDQFKGQKHFIYYIIMEIGQKQLNLRLGLRITDYNLLINLSNACLQVWNISGHISHHYQTLITSRNQNVDPFLKFQGLFKIKLCLQISFCIAWQTHIDFWSFRSFYWTN